jgi:hypothetical protein
LLKAWRDNINFGHLMYRFCTEVKLVYGIDIPAEVEASGKKGIARYLHRRGLKRIGHDGRFRCGGTRRPVRAFVHDYLSPLSNVLWDGEIQDTETLLDIMHGLSTTKTRSAVNESVVISRMRHGIRNSVVESALLYNRNRRPTRGDKWGTTKAVRGKG